MPDYSIFQIMLRDPSFIESVEAAARQEAGVKEDIPWLTKRKKEREIFETGTQQRIGQATAAQEQYEGATKLGAKDYLATAAPYITTLLGGLIGGARGAKVGKSLGFGAQQLQGMSRKSKLGRAQSALQAELDRLKSEQALAETQMEGGIADTTFGYGVEQDRLTRAQRDYENQVGNLKWLREQQRLEQPKTPTSVEAALLANPDDPFYKELFYYKNRDKTNTGGLPLGDKRNIDLIRENALLGATNYLSSKGEPVLWGETGKERPPTIFDIMNKSQEMTNPPPQIDTTIVDRPFWQGDQTKIDTSYAAPDSNLIPFIQQYMNAGNMGQQPQIGQQGFQPSQGPGRQMGQLPANVRPWNQVQVLPVTQWTDQELLYYGSQ